MIAGFPVTSPCGMRISATNGTMKMHQGVDLGTPIGTPVIVIAYGEIEYDRWNDVGLVAMLNFDQFPSLRFDLPHLSKCNGNQGSKL
jgi:murein DD-endopeptidase MepM/ murein hydrolase activator NlpD